MADKRIVVWVQRFKDRPALVLQWLDPETGKRKSKSAETADEGQAEKKRADLEYELNNGLHKESSRLTWDKFRELFEEEYVCGKRPKTQRRYRSMFDLFERLCDPKSLRSITKRTVSRFGGQMRQVPTWDRVGMANSTIRTNLQFLRTALNWAAEQKMIPACPKFPTVRVPRKRPQPIPLESFERLLAKAPDANMRAFLLTGWLAGLRLGEAAALEWTESEEVPYLALERNRIILPARFVKGVEDQWVPLDPELRKVLEALPRQGKKVFRFVAERDGHLLAVNTISDQVLDLAKRAGVKLSMRSLRKGFGCHYAGIVPAQVLQGTFSSGHFRGGQFLAELFR
ncbi:MAG TPA: phage integrase SAM-like domain-containing protein [Gemmataceae bacterium]|nr:phage integrase SAM-like domain-containing protein [Gemmataceae bacterium]